MRATALLALGFLLPASLGRAASPPAAFLSPEAAVVGVWKHPARSLERLEALARTAGLTPAGAEPGWWAEGLRDEAPDGLDLDFDRPFGFALRPDPEDPDGEAGVTLVLPVRRPPPRTLSLDETELRVTRAGDYAIVTTVSPPGPPPGKTPFAFPPSTGELEARSDLAIHVDLRGLPLEQLGEDAAARRSFGERVTLGVGLEEAGASVFVASHPRPGSPAARLAARLRNTDAPLVVGIPAVDYALLFGGRTDPEAAKSLLRLYLEAGLGPDDDENRALAATLTEALEVLASAEGGCDASSVGVAVDGSLARAFALGRSRCKKAEEVERSWSRLAEVVNRGIQRATAHGKPSQIRIAETRSDIEVAGVTLSALRLAAGGEGPTLEDAPGWVRAPLLHGAVDARHTVFAWNAPTRILKALLASAPSDRSPDLRAFARARARLIEPRVSEGYLRLGPVAGLFLPPELAPLRILLSTLPPIAGAARTYPDGTTLTQIWLPNEVAGLVAALIQLDEGPPPDLDTSPNDDGDPERKKI